MNQQKTLDPLGYSQLGDQQGAGHYVTKAQLEAGLAEARRTRTDQTFRETALASAIAIGQPAATAEATRAEVLANAEAFLAFLRGDQ